MSPPRIPKQSLAEALRDAYPELERVAAAGGKSVFLVGGAVRDLLLGHGRADIDLAVLGDPLELSAALGAETLAEHERFGTVKVKLDGHELDLASARTETYDRPGALPIVAPAMTIEGDLGRRDFTINAMAVPLADPGRLIDPHGGGADLEAGLLRILHAASFVDDPTRAIRAARYASRFDLALEPETEALLRRTDLGTVSADRRQAELYRLAAESSAPGGFELLGRWGLVDLRENSIDLARAVSVVLDSERWRGEVSRPDAVLAAALGPVGEEMSLAAAGPARPSRAVELARGRSGVELALARALGAEWLDEYLDRWRQVSLEIDGADLIAAGVRRGPELGRGLQAALDAKLDGEAHDREQELAIAIAAASPR
jgi:tRNA nucleotidyltransferase (CCA-adding enzyme)